MEYKLPEAIDSKGDSYSERVYADGWNACRAEMLASAPPAPQAEPSHGDEPLSQEQFNQCFDALPWHVRCMWPTQASEAQQEPVSADAERYGARLNDASWAAVEAWNREVMGPMTGAIFNNIKGVVRAAILKYCDGYTHPAQQAKPQPLSEDGAWNLARYVYARSTPHDSPQILLSAKELKTIIEYAAHGIQGS